VARHVLDVDGRAERRTVAEHTGDLPVTLKAEYRLEGERIAPEDVVGRSGRLEAVFTVRNGTAAPTEITYRDGQGKDVTETVDLVVPYVGTLESVLPSGFAAVAAEGASVAGDGRGATTVSWSLVLFDPLGEPAQQLRWSADVEDAVLPPAELTVVPVSPSGNGVIEDGERAVQEGATGLTTLAGGVLKVDGKLGELQAGAAELLAGLDQLAAGAEALNTGLAGSAAPGAEALAAGPRHRRGRRQRAVHWARRARDRRAAPCRRA
jgi:putative membrane protein